MKTPDQFVLAGVYDDRLVVLSILIAVCASYVALDLAGRVTRAQGKTRIAWLSGGATAMGIGIWAMHYVGMLAFNLPIPVRYDWPTVLVSLLAAIFASGIALFVVSRKTMGFVETVFGSLFMGGGIAGMHYIGMAAMRLSAMCRYSLWIVAASIVLAIAISWVALFLAFHLRRETKSVSGRKVLSALAMGGAIPLMHYTGMAATTFRPSEEIPDLSHAVSISALGITGIVIVTVFVLGLAVLTSLFDRLYTDQKDFNQSIIDGLPGLFCLIDEKGKISRGNEALSKTSGYSAEEISRMSALDFFKEPDRSLMAESMQQAFSQGGVTAEASFVAKDRTEAPYLFSAQRLMFEGKPCLVALGHDISERKRLEEQRERLVSLVEASPDFIGYASPNTMEIQYINKHGRAMCGIGEDEDLAKIKITDVHPVWMNKLFAEVIIPTAIRDGAWQGEGAFQHRDGHEIPVSMVLMARKDAHGEVDILYTVSRDITERKWAEKLLQDSESKHRALFEGSSDATLLSYENGFVDCNSAALTMFGYSSLAEILALKPADLSPPNQPDGAPSQAVSEQRIAVAFLKGKNHFEWWHQRKNGDVFPSEVTLTALTVNGQQALMGTVRDITERKRAETQSLLQSAALNAAANAIVVTDACGAIQWVNPAFTRLTGYSLEESVGQNPRILKSDKQDESYYRNLWNTILAGKVWAGEITNVRKDGQSYIEEMTIAPVHSNKGEITNFIAVKQDITERKRFELELVQARESAEAANRAKSEFLANMSHEIRTPMNGIIGMTELVLDTELNPEQLEYLNMVKGSADSLLSLLNDILDFSKMEAGKMELDRLRFSLRKSLGEVVKTLGVKAQQKGLELVFDVSPEVPDTVIGDPARLRQVLVNLVSNSIKFTEKGEIEVRVRMEASQSERTALRFSIRDTGIGIPADKQRQIFEAFTQADSSTTRKYGGTGLGLTIVVQLVGLMGGKIWVESEAGQGSTFHFTALVEQEAGRAPQASLDVPELAGVRVLVVDDNATNRRVLGESLKRWKMLPTIVGSAAEAMNAFQEAHKSGTRFSVVLTDAHMPEVDGFDLVEMIRKAPSLSNIEIVILTSGGKRGDAARCQSLGVAAYLSKPFDRLELREVLHQVLATGPVKLGDRTLVTRHTLRERRQLLSFLVAEDNAVNQTLIARLLVKRGHTVVLAQNGREAVELLERQHFDIVLMDIQMPEMDGFEATKLIREKEKEGATHLPIIALTAHAMKGDEEACLASGMDGYVSKPLKLEELFSVLEKVVPGMNRRSDANVPAISS